MNLRNSNTMSEQECLDRLKHLKYMCEVGQIKPEHLLETSFLMARIQDIRYYKIAKALRLKGN